MRLGNLLDRFEKAAAVGEGEDLPRSVRPHRLDGHAAGRQSGAGGAAQAEARRNAVLEHIERRFARRRRDPLRFVGRVAMTMPMSGAMSMLVMMAAAEQPRASDVDREAERRDRNRLAEMDRHGRQETRHRLVAYQQRDHRENDGARESGEVAELARAECEARVVRVAARERVGERGQQERAGMGAHVQSVGDQRDRAEQPAADDLDRHHRGAEPDDRPGPALARLVTLAEEHMAVEGRIGRAFDVAHGRVLNANRSGRRR